jgi:succinoglycan biosynthesis protein ExoA
MKASDVTVLIPAMNEEIWIEDCLRSVAAQDYPHDLIEVVVVVDAASDDQTDGRAKEVLDALDFARTEVVRSSRGGTPNNLNVGLHLARGEVLCRVDARSRIPANYVRTCVARLSESADVAVVGGAQVAVPPRADDVGVGVARALNNRFAMGLSRYRRGATTGESDTVYLGAFRTADLREVGGWNPEFSTNQDFELNRRMRRLGRTWFEASIPVEYVPRSSISLLFRQYVRFGGWKVRYWRRTGDRPRPRQLLLLVGVPVLAATGVGLAVRSPHRALVTVCGVTGAFALESVGTTGPSGGLRARAWSVLAMAGVGSGWLWGAWRALSTRSR